MLDQKRSLSFRTCSELSVLVRHLSKDASWNHTLQSEKFGNAIWIFARYIIIYIECEGRIEKAVPRIAVWHHESAGARNPHSQLSGSFELPRHML